MKQDIILTPQAGWEGKFLGLKMTGPGDSSRTLVIVPMVALQPGSGRHQRQYLRLGSGAWDTAGPIKSAIGLQLVPPGLGNRVQPQGDRAGMSEDSKIPTDLGPMLQRTPFWLLSSLTPPYGVRRPWARDHGHWEPDHT